MLLATFISLVFGLTFALAQCHYYAARQIILLPTQICPKQCLDWFNHFCTAHTRAKFRDTQITLHVTNVDIYTLCNFKNMYTKLVHETWQNMNMADNNKMLMIFTWFQL